MGTMLYLSRTYPEQLRSMVAVDARYDYPFSATCVNVTAVLVCYLSLPNDQTGKPWMSPLGPNMTLADTSEVAAFADMALADSLEGNPKRRCFDELFCIAATVVHATWLQLAAGGATLLDFKSALDPVPGAIRKALKQAKTVSQLRAHQVNV